MLRSTFTKGKPKKIFNQCYKNFDNEKFEEELKKLASWMLDFESFHPAFKTTLYCFVPLKQKLEQSNNQPFMTKTINKTNMNRSEK